ncbi:MAG TPA: DAK2 domain-containing protein, partial [Vicinamibacterales bacterium]|nr:DAK2 domain-containing protein [Vicinamibacterales bacterium]
MIDGAWDGDDLLSAIRHAAVTLHSRVDEINALNVFPVPDGDTGSNMLATVQGAIEEMEGVPSAERSVSRVGSALAFGALMGARGNSGVILSQLFRGFGEAIDGSRAVGGIELAEALNQGCRQAFAAVARPVEGTILTVARDAADAAREAARKDAALEAVLAAAVAAAGNSVERTPDLLPILRHAGVVDAGGKGYELLLQGALASLRGEPVSELPFKPEDIVLPLVDALEAEGFGYETVFIVTPPAGGRLDLPAIRDNLEEFGVSVLVAGDNRAVKVHVHTERPDHVIAYGLSLGTLSRIQVENLDRQAMAQRELVAHAAEVREQERATPGTTTDSRAAAGSRGSDLAVVAVAPGAGLSEVFQTLGATVVPGGSGANPSAGDLAQAVASTSAPNVIVLPNNPNVTLAARQAGQLTARVKVEVVPTRNAAEGIAAMLEFTTDAPLKKTARAMAAAAKRVQTLQVTAAVRDARIGRHRVHRNEFIVLGPDDGLIAFDPDRTA